MNYFWMVARTAELPGLSELEGRRLFLSLPQPQNSLDLWKEPKDARWAEEKRQETIVCSTVVNSS